MLIINYFLNVERDQFSRSVSQLHSTKLIKMHISSLDNSLKSSDDTFVLAIGWIALIVGIILNIFGYIRTGIYWKCFKRNGMITSLQLI